LEIRAQLHVIPFFADVLPTPALDALALVTEPRFFPVGSVLIQQGQIGASMFCLIEGEVRVVFEDARQHQSDIIRLTEGSVVGEMEVLTGQPRLATVLAATDVRALEISSDELKALLRSSPALEESFSAMLSRRHAIYIEVATNRAPLLPRIVSGVKRMFGAGGRD
jgi:CRP-like cAMP-binding protein